MELILIRTRVRVSLGCGPIQTSLLFARIQHRLEPFLAIRTVGITPHSEHSAGSCGFARADQLALDLWSTALPCECRSKRGFSCAERLFERCNRESNRPAAKKTRRSIGSERTFEQDA